MGRRRRDRNPAVAKAVEGERGTGASAPVPTNTRIDLVVKVVARVGAMGVVQTGAEVMRAVGRPKTSLLVDGATTLPLVAAEEATVPRAAGGTRTGKDPAVTTSDPQMPRQTATGHRGLGRRSVDLTTVRADRRLRVTKKMAPEPKREGGPMENLARADGAGGLDEILKRPKSWTCWVASRFP